METYNYFSTGEFSSITGVTLRTLRYYDKIGLLEPAFKDCSQHRYYSHKQFIYLDFIIRFKELGFSLKQIKSILNDLEISEIRQMLIKKEEELEEQIKHLNRQKQIIKDFQLFTSYLETEPDNDFSIKLKRMQERKVLYTKKNFVDLNLANALKLFNKLIKLEKNYNGYGWYFIILNNYFENKNKTFSVEFGRGIRNNDIQNNNIKAIESGLYVIKRFKGGLDEMEKNYFNLKEWINENGYEMIAQPINYYINILFPHSKLSGIQDQIRELQIQVRKK
jgi:DNA-binding transcriptional MerR regulator